MTAFAGDETDANLKWSKEQIDYMLGATTGRSYVVGYGKNYPTKPRHRASSCPLMPDEYVSCYFRCMWSLGIIWTSGFEVKVIL